MYQQERMDEIMRILKKNHYVTVDYLVKEIKYSPASIRRDLTLLEKQGDKYITNFFILDKDCRTKPCFHAKTREQR